MQEPPPDAPELIQLGDFYTAALWSGVLAMACTSLLYAAFRMQGLPRLLFLSLAGLLALISVLTILLRSWLEVDPQQRSLRLRRGLLRPLWTARRWPLEKLQRVELISDQPPAHQHLPYDVDDEGQPQALFVSYYTRLTIDGAAINLPAEEDKRTAREQAQRLAHIANLTVTEGQQEEPGRRARRWGLWLALANAVLVAAYAFYAVSAVPPQPETARRLRGGWIPEPYPAAPERSRPLTARDRLRPGDRLWAQWKRDAWFAAEVLAAPTEQGVRVHFRGYGPQDDQVLSLDKLRLPTPRKPKEAP